MSRWMARTTCTVMAAALAACAAVPPLPRAPAPRLSPASLGHPLALQQVLTVSAAGHTRQFEVALEVDAESIRMALLQTGQVLARLEWDGRALHEERVAGWPAAVSGERVLADLQWVHWPTESLREVLPPGWDLSVEADQRSLRFGGRQVLRVRHAGSNDAELDNVAEGYRLRIESRTLEGAR